MITREQLFDFIDARKVHLAVLLSVLLLILVVLLVFSLAADSRARNSLLLLEKQRNEDRIPPERMWLPVETLEEPGLLYFRGALSVWTEEDARKMYKEPDQAVLDAIAASARAECMSILESVP